MSKILPIAAPDNRDFPIVGIGASAGGLDASRKLVSGLRKGGGMAFILVQHLDPTHESMMVDLLSGHTTLTVCQAADGMTVERDHFYVIPAATYLSVSLGILHLSRPVDRHGARLPFDFLLHSLAADRGAAAICVILSGTGADGSLGLKSIKAKHGLVIAQDPDEAGYDGMPRGAIMTGAVDLVLPVDEIPAALLAHHQTPPPAVVHDDLPAIIALPHVKTGHDFALYNEGTLRRRIERRRALAAVTTGDTAAYLERPGNDVAERDLRAKDLLINVTRFFRDPKVFDLLARTVVPDLIHNRPRDQPIRIWIAGCGTGEEAYSLAMIFQEQIAAADSGVKLQVFASDVDPDAVASARDGLYPETIAADVSLTRLNRYFTKEDLGFRVVPDLRACVVFTVQDVLVDPPFSQIDLISCRNLLIYLQSDARAKVISQFHFALRPGGVLLLGSSETAGDADGCFEVISKPERLYRHIGRHRPAEAGQTPGSGRIQPRAGQSLVLSRQSGLEALCQRLLLDSHVPAAVLVNRGLECLYATGPVERYLHVAAGIATQDLLAMAHRDMRTRLRAAIQQANQAQSRVVLSGGRTTYQEQPISFAIDVQPVTNDGEALLLICFVPESERERAHGMEDCPGAAALERELDSVRTELKGAVRSLEISNEEHKAINEEALSAQEEFQSTNEELLTSREELQSLNEELTALNSQLRETLERQRTTANDLQNVLNSTNVATIFLDLNLNIRFFTPATRALFNIIPGDIGRPLADLTALAADDMLLADAMAVPKTLTPVEREIETGSGIWYIRRILPYRTQDDQIEGVVVTFSDITARTHIKKALDAAMHKAEQANIAKSRFLAAASHDLRQPLQTLTLVRGILARKIRENKMDEALKLVDQLDETIDGMAGMLNTLLDINQIEAGNVRPEIVRFSIGGLLDRLRDDFAYQAAAQNVSLRVVPCSVTVNTDPNLLSQMIRNLLSNALKYTRHGKVLLGCRRNKDRIRIEIWDTGIGIPEAELQAIFEEYHQIDNPARERGRGLGLGLTIVRRLAVLLGHPVHVRSRIGKGSVFTIEIRLPEGVPMPSAAPSADASTGPDAGRTGMILVVEDDPEVRALLSLVLRDEGHQVMTASDGAAAMELAARGNLMPDLILADFNLPGAMNGLQLATALRARIRRDVPVVILTGDISTTTLHDIAGLNHVQLNKPVRPKELLAVIRRLLPPSRPRLPGPAAAASEGTPVVYVVDDDSQVRQAIRRTLEADGQKVDDYESCEAFLDAWHPGHEACLVIDAYLPGMNGLELLRRLRDAGHQLPAIMITGDGDVSIAVQAMKAGASDFIEKPVGHDDLLACVARAMEQAKDSTKRVAWREDAANHVAGLTARQKQIMEMVLAGHPSKNIAADLGISQRTVENHRASIMKRTGSKSLPALARLAIAAAG